MENEKKKEKVSSYGLGIITGLLMSGVVIAGVFTGKMLYERRMIRETAATETTETTETTEESSVLNKDTLNKIVTIERMIDDRFYLEDVDKETLQDGICRGMVEALDDRYAAYYTKEELSKQMEKNEGIYYGIGAYISIDTESELPFVSGIIEKTPAEEAGIRVGDIIYAADGIRTFQMTLEEVTSHVKGDEGTTVQLTLIRDGEVITLDVERRRVDRPTVSSKMLEDDIGYLAISEFKDVTVDQFTENYAVLKSSGAKALILDLRGNPGGLLDAVVNIGQQILPEGLIVYTEDKKGNRMEFDCDGTREIQIPLVVLVNGGSASASEVLTGAIKDYQIGTVIGTKTYGKGIVQKIISLADGSAIKLTTDGYFTPNGNNIHGKGIEPDIVVEFDADAYYSEEHIDNQLETAKEYLKEQLKK